MIKYQNKVCITCYENWKEKLSAVYLEECKYRMKKTRMTKFKEAELESDSESELEYDIELELKSELKSNTE